MLDVHPNARDSEPRVIEQEWDRYTAEDHDVWAVLFERRMAELRTTGSQLFLRGAEQIGLCPDCVPDLRVVNAKLAAITGWRALPVDGFLPAPEFFRCLAARIFPTAIT